MRKAALHVRRKGFQVNLKLICTTSSAKIYETIRQLGQSTGLREAIVSDATDPGLQQALKDLLVFSADIVGSEGARMNLRYQQIGTMIRFGGGGAFITPNVNDLGAPLVVTIHLQGNGVGLASMKTAKLFNTL